MNKNKILLIGKNSFLGSSFLEKYYSFIDTYISHTELNNLTGLEKFTHIVNFSYSNDIFFSNYDYKN